MTPTLNTRKHRLRRKQRRRWHKGRLTFVLTVAAFVIISIMSLLSRCSGEAGTVFRGGGDFRKPVPEAIQAGHRDAAEVLDTPPGSMERDNALLKIRARETNLRKAGFNHAADDYINSARDLLIKKGVIQ